MPGKRPLRERFEEKVDRASSLQSWGGTKCHELRATLMPNGYGQIRNGKTDYAHRVSWELTNGPIPKGMYVLHRCDNRKCVNPEHLFLGSFDDNMSDMVSKRRQAHGIKNWHAKLTEDEVREIRFGGGKQEDTARKFNVSRTTVSQIRSGDTWRFINKI